MNVKDYLKQDISIRQKHLRLKENCLERGGGSPIHRGVLAEYLKGQIYNKPADLCHACNNPKCSNPRHLYWGTRSENVKDSINYGSWTSPYQRLVEKMGEKEAKEYLSSKSKNWHKSRNTPQHKNTTYINNGIISKRISKDEPIPEGWEKGRKLTLNE